MTEVDWMVARAFAISLTKQQRAAFLAMTPNAEATAAFARQARGEIEAWPTSEAVPSLDATALGVVDYALGRMTSSTLAASQWLSGAWSQLRPATREAIAAQVSTAISAGKAGMEIDVRHWGGVLALEGISLAENAAEVPFARGF
jgi:hypothetical protein